MKQIHLFKKGFVIFLQGPTFWDFTKIGRESEKSGKMFWLKIGRNENFIMQSRYEEQTL